MTPDNRTVNMLWWGPMTSMERLSVASFLAHGHEVRVWSYAATIPGLPAGATLADAREIVPEASVFYDDAYGSLAPWASLFRLKLLLARGGWWADTDAVAVAPFDFPAEHVFATEWLGGRPYLTDCVLKAPAGSPILATAVGGAEAT